jgi:hypothetical protein
VPLILHLCDTVPIVYPAELYAAVKLADSGRAVPVTPVEVAVLVVVVVLMEVVELAAVIGLVEVRVKISSLPVAGLI